ncbi:hypothetical protein Q7P36_008865 [Cladosporium allicinum]
MSVSGSSFIRPTHILFLPTTAIPNSQTKPNQRQATTTTINSSLPTKTTIMSSSGTLLPSATFKMAARIKAFGMSYAAVVGTVPSGPSGPSITTDPSAANEENDPSGAVRNGWYADRYEPE